MVSTLSNDIWKKRAQQLTLSEYCPMEEAWEQKTFNRYSRYAIMIHRWRQLVLQRAHTSEWNAIQLQINSSLLMSGEILTGSTTWANLFRDSEQNNIAGLDFSSRINVFTRHCKISYYGNYIYMHVNPAYKVLGSHIRHEQETKKTEYGCEKRPKKASSSIT